jgi:hypothetical protein
MPGMGMGVIGVKEAAKTLALALMLSICAQSGMAQTNKEIQAAGEVAGELQQCSVYFLVVSTCVAEQDAELSLSYRKAADKVGELAISLGRTAGVSDEAYMAGSQLMSETMKKSMAGKCINSAVLLKKYMNFCRQLARDADPRLAEWIKCVQQKRTCNGP